MSSSVLRSSLAAPLASILKGITIPTVTRVEGDHANRNLKHETHSSNGNPLQWKNDDGLCVNLNALYANWHQNMIFPTRYKESHTADRPHWSSLLERSIVRWGCVQWTEKIAQGIDLNATLLKIYSSRMFWMGKYAFFSFPICKETHRGANRFIPPSKKTSPCSFRSEGEPIYIPPIPLVGLDIFNILCLLFPFPNPFQRACLSPSARCHHYWNN
jgi:hypothetical protein